MTPVINVYMKESSARGLSVDTLWCCLGFTADIRILEVSWTKGDPSIFET